MGLPYITSEEKGRGGGVKKCSKLADKQNSLDVAHLHLWEGVKKFQNYVSVIDGSTLYPSPLLSA